MTPDETNDFMESALQALSDKQDALEREYGIGSAARFTLDQATERLEFFDADDRTVLVAQFIEIGSHATDRNTFRWAWSNPFVLEPLRAKAEILQELAAETGYAMFACETPFEIEDEHMAWALAAVGVRKLGAFGAYCAPNLSGSLHAFVAITRIQKLVPPLEPASRQPFVAAASRSRLRFG